jgi:hypothetical protein
LDPCLGGAEIRVFEGDLEADQVAS